MDRSSSANTSPVPPVRPTPALSTLHESHSASDLTSSASTISHFEHAKNVRHVPSLSQSVNASHERAITALAGAGRHKPQASSGGDFSPGDSIERRAQRLEPPDPTALLRVQHGVVKSRSGSVLGRGFILKNDRLPARSARALDFRLKGAPNFRSGGEGIYGSAQPSITGLRTVLSILGCHSRGSGKAVWICTREEPVIYIGGSPFVLRDAEEPLKNYSLSERPEALENIEKRLGIVISRGHNAF